MFSLKQIGKNTFYIENPVKIGVYRLNEQEVILIDTGIDDETAEKILNVLTENNFKLKFIISTHSNADHVGGNNYLQKTTGCKIFSSPVEAAIGQFPILNASLIYGGFPHPTITNRNFIAKESCILDIKEAVLPSGMEIFPLKGHFLGMIGVKTPDNICFLGDSLIGENVLKRYIISYIYNIEEYLKTLDFLENLKGDLFVVSHGEPVFDLVNIIKANRDKTLKIIDDVLNICENKTNFEEILKKLFDKNGFKLSFPQYAITGSTVKSIISYLSYQRKITFEIHENMVYWTKM